MVPDLLRDESSGGGSHFTFSNPKPHRGRSDAGDSRGDGSDYMAWAERIKGDRGGYFGGSRGRSVGAWTRRSAATPLMSSSPRYVRHGWWSAEQGEGEDEDEVEGDGYGYGTPSPLLWKNSPRNSRRGAGPSARAQEIARYRQEMLELVRGLPESEYELSLRDMVEDRGLLLAEGKESEDGEKSEMKGKRSERKESAAATGGLLRRMSFPFSVGDRRKRLSASRENKSGLGGIGSSSTSSNSSTGSSSSSTTTTAAATTSNSRSRNKRRSQCYCFFRRNEAGDMD